jgi:hypothetical protein
VRWLTPCRDLAILVTEGSTRGFQAELFHFGGDPRSVAAELRLLKPGVYEARLLAEGEDVPSETLKLQVEAGKPSHLSIRLPAGKLCVLKIAPEK